MKPNPDLDFFRKNSVVFVPNLIEAELCSELVAHFTSNEAAIIEEFSRDSRGLALDTTNNESQTIKYFEYPLKLCFPLYGKIVRSEIFELAEFLLGEPVHLLSCEVHSRAARSTAIPYHQDNGYYGLADGNALTFYISLTHQRPEMGGLRYLSNSVYSDYEHTASSTPAFSLKLKDEEETNGRERLNYDYKPGDATIHHSRSIHYAEPVPLNAERALVFRMSFFSLKARRKQGHQEWHRKMLELNRLRNTTQACLDTN